MECIGGQMVRRRRWQEPSGQGESGQNPGLKRQSTLLKKATFLTNEHHRQTVLSSEFFFFFRFEDQHESLLPLDGATLREGYRVYIHFLQIHREERIG